MLSYRRHTLVGLILALIFMAGITPVSAEPPKEVKNALSKLVPGLKPDSIRKTGAKGLYEATFGAQVVYVTDDGRYLFRGDLIDLERGKNISEQARQQVRANFIKAVDEKSMVIFAGKDVKHTVTVFTDIDCGYCRKLHGQIDEFNKRGIKVRYMSYPRSGINTPSYKKAVSVWCADDRKKAMTLAKQGKPVADKECKNPVKQHMAIGEKLGVRGTPTIVLANGRVLPGYVSSDKLVKVLNLDFIKGGTAGK